MSWPKPPNARRTALLMFFYKISQIKESFYRRAAWWLPERLAYWATMRVIAHATKQIRQPGNLTAKEILQLWNDLPE